MKRLTTCFAIALVLIGCKEKPKAENVPSSVTEMTAFAMPTGSGSSFEVTDHTFFCNYENSDNQQKFYTLSSETEINDLVTDITDAMGLPSHFKVMAANVHNATAFMYTKGDDKNRYIFFSPAFFMNVEETTESKWARISIMAHEIGHHLCYHTLTRNKADSLELQADFFSGFVLRRMGATKRESVEAIEKMGNEKATATHPDKRTRTDAILAGWMEADYRELRVAARLAAKRPPEKPVPRDPKPETAPQKPGGKPSQKPPTKTDPQPAESDTTSDADGVVEYVDYVPEEVTPATKPTYKPFYVVNTVAVTSEAAAIKEKQRLEEEGYKAGYLWIPDYPSLGKAKMYAVYIGPFYSQFNCEIAVENYRLEHPEAYGVLVSTAKTRVQINGFGKVSIKQNN